jgi:hypothetical protein
MANVKISQLTAKGSNIVATDRFAIAQDDGGGTFSSKYITGAEIVTKNINTYSSALNDLVLADANKIIKVDNNSANDLRIPTNTSQPFPIGTEIIVIQYGTGQTTVAPTATVTMRSSGGKNKLSAQYAQATLIKIGTNEWVLFGDITT